MFVTCNKLQITNYKFQDHCIWIPGLCQGFPGPRLFSRTSRSVNLNILIPGLSRVCTNPVCSLYILFWNLDHPINTVQYKMTNWSIPELASLFCTSSWFEYLSNTHKLSSLNNIKHSGNWTWQHRSVMARKLSVVVYSVRSLSRTHMRPASSDIH